MTDPTPAAPSSPTRPRWLPTLTKFRLTVLMLALAFGLTGMARQDRRMVNIGIVFAVIGAILRFVNRKRPTE